MCKCTRKSRLLAGAAVTTAALSLLVAVKVSAASGNAAAFFRGKTITWIVPYKAGGGYDTYSRLIVPFLGKYTGATVVVENKPGAGGLIGFNLIAAAKPDGLTLGIINGVGAISSQIARERGRRFNVTKFSWIGRVTGETKAWVVRSSLKNLRSVRDFLRSKKTYRWGATGPGASGYLEGLLLESALHRKFDIVTGFGGFVEIAAAMDRGEVDMSSDSIDSLLTAIHNGDERPLLVLGLEKDKFLPRVPTLTDDKILLGKDGFALLRAYTSITDVARVVAAPPGLSSDRLAFLRAAFRKTLQDPELLAKAKGIRRPIDYLSGPRVLGDFREAVEHSPKVLRRFIVSAYHAKRRKKKK